MNPQYAIYVTESDFIHWCRLLQEFHCPKLTLSEIEYTAYFEQASAKEKERIKTLLQGKVFPDDFPDAQNEWLRVCLGF